MAAPNHVVIATHNIKKSKEMVDILSDRFPATKFETLANFPGAPEPEETGSTYRENALIKAISAYQFTGITCIADDAGLEIDALEGAPGLYSKRFGGESMSFPDKMAKIQSLLEGVPEEKRTARFRCWVAIVSAGHEPTAFEGVLEGFINLHPIGSHGFGYDPIFYVPELKRTLAQLPPNEKHKISHRGKVLDKVAEFWQSSPVCAASPGLQTG